MVELGTCQPYVTHFYLIEPRIYSRPAAFFDSYSMHHSAHQSIGSWTCGGGGGAVVSRLVRLAMQAWHRRSDPRGSENSRTRTPQSAQ